MATIIELLEDWISLQKQVKNYLSSINSAQTVLTSHLGKIKDFSDTMGTELGTIRSDIETYLPKISDLSTPLETMKSSLTTMQTYLNPSTYGSLGYGLSEMITNVEDIKTKAGNLDAIATSVSSSQSSLSKLFTGLVGGSDSLKVKFDTMIGKMGKLDSLPTIVTKLGSLESTIKDLTLDIPAIEVNMDDSALLAEMKKHTEQILSLNNTIQSMDANFKNLGNKMGILENINKNLINQITLQKYSLNLLTSNLPLFDELMGTQARLMKLSDLGLKALSFKVTPQEWVDEFNRIMEEVFSFTMPDIPDIDISWPDPSIFVDIIDDIVDEDEDEDEDEDKEEPIICGQPGKPTISATKKYDHILLSWSAPSFTGGPECPITWYRILRKGPGEVRYSVLVSRTGSQLSYQDKDVVVGTGRYYYRLTAENKDKNSVSSDSASVSF